MGKRLWNTFIVDGEERPYLDNPRGRRKGSRRRRSTGRKKRKAPPGGWAAWARKMKAARARKRGGGSMAKRRRKSSKRRRSSSRRRRRSTAVAVRVNPPRRRRRHRVHHRRRHHYRRNPPSFGGMGRGVVGQIGSAAVDAGEILAGKLGVRYAVSNLAKKDPGSLIGIGAQVVAGVAGGMALKKVNARFARNFLVGALLSVIEGAVQSTVLKAAATGTSVPVVSAAMGVYPMGKYPERAALGAWPLGDDAYQDDDSENAYASMQ